MTMVMHVDIDQFSTTEMKLIIGVIFFLILLLMAMAFKELRGTHIPSSPPPIKPEDFSDEATKRKIKNLILYILISSVVFYVFRFIVEQ